MKRSPRWVVWMAACVFVLLGVAAAPRKSSAIWIGLPGIAPYPEIGEPDMPGRFVVYLPMYSPGKIGLLKISVPYRTGIRHSRNGIETRRKSS